jgi:hypothetical protein
MILISILIILCIIITIAIKCKNLTFFAVSYDVVERRQYLGDAQTKCTRHRPWCGDDVDALTLGVAQVLAMVWAIAVGHHGARRSGAQTCPRR